MLKRSIAIFFLGIFVLALVSCDLLHGSKPARPPVVVGATSVVLQPWQETIQAVGSLSASQGIVIKPETSGRITAIYFQSGENVKAGDPLLQLNPAMLQAKLDAAKAQTDLSAADYARASTLYKQKVFAKADMDKVLASYRANQAQQAQAQAALDQTLIRAPFSGRIGLRLVNQGDYIDPSKAIANLDAIDPLRVDFKIPGTDASKVTVGTTVIIHSDAYPKQTFLASVYAVDSQIDADTRSLGVRASLSNSKQQLLPGAFVNVSLQVAQPQSLTTVPETAVNNDETGSYVYRIIDHKAVKTPVTVAFQRDGKIALSTGLKEGEQIISVGGFKVLDKAPVIVGG
ncbi:efflux RND transporter periplasmic adaptor subunit [Candidatus Rickettsiella viridis]|uniref:efflux RND transporter periplasmic adaptor subunit n=1 Tax=Candidatus Rickettsiella viridis TaxID=676208 RepID=UPI000F82BD1B|nr:efflux RND transporter periplasmic adaptor subunit [Candidatus Rickettsiella viridis]